MHVKRAAQLLGLELTELTEQAVNDAAKERMRLAHPDNGGDADLAPSQIARAKEARSSLLEYLQSGLEAGTVECPACLGKGRLKGRGFAAHECRRCNGTGTISA